MLWENGFISFDIMQCMMCGNGGIHFGPQVISVRQDIYRYLLFADTQISEFTQRQQPNTATHGPLDRYVKLRVVHAPGTFSLPQLAIDPNMHHGTCVMHVPWCMSGSITSGFLWNLWRGKRSRHSRRTRNPQFYVSGRRPMVLRRCMDNFAYLRKKTRGNKFIPCSQAICVLRSNVSAVLKVEFSFQSGIIHCIHTLVTRNSFRSYFGVRWISRRTGSLLWRHQWHPFLFIRHTDDVKCAMRVYPPGLLPNQKRQSTLRMGLFTILSSWLWRIVKSVHACDDKYSRVSKCLFYFVGSVSNLIYFVYILTFSLWLMHIYIYIYKRNFLSVPKLQR